MLRLLTKRDDAAPRPALGRVRVDRVPWLVLRLDQRVENAVSMQPLVVISGSALALTIERRSHVLLRLRNKNQCGVQSK
jgi:hypothetical protein